MSADREPSVIWGRVDRAQIYMDGSSLVTARTKVFREAARYVRGDIVDDMKSALRAILSVSERHQTATFNVISDAARAALSNSERTDG